jgi:hypothetical protein
LLTFTALGINLYGAYHLKRESDELKVIPENSQPFKFINANRALYTSTRWSNMYFGDIDYKNSMDKIAGLRREMLSSEDAMVRQADAWPDEFLEFRQNFNKSSRLSHASKYEDIAQQNTPIGNLVIINAQRAFTSYSQLSPIVQCIPTLTCLTLIIS